MNPNYNQESSKKGEQFEKYVQDIIFPDAHYELIHRTSDSKQNTYRYPKKSLEPDFQFKCRKTGKEFHIEAKWRAKPFKNRFDVLSENQFELFPSLESKSKPIFILFGYGGTASNPDYVHLIPLQDIRSRFIPSYDISKYQIAKAFYPNENFDTQTEPEPNSEKDPEVKPEIKSKTSPKVFALAAVGVVAILAIIFGYATSDTQNNLTPEEQLKDLVENYYQDMNSNHIEELPNYLSSNVVNWYGAKDPSTDQIIKNAKNHRGTYPYSTTDIDWNSFNVAKQSNKDYLVSYDMIYKSKKDINDDYNVYNLHMITKWDDNFKLKSISEIRN